MRLFMALVIDLAVLGVAYAALVLAGVDPFVSAFGLLILVAPLLHLLIARLAGLGGRKRPDASDS